MVGCKERARLAEAKEQLVQLPAWSAMVKALLLQGLPELATSAFGRLFEGSLSRF